mmetsp:Transcript_1335/g.4195  ORF Transcript_1335/g.4195 Transcript_1335/m.4195 type:complete len:206 (+) Transcript_1335:143-760(+)
MYIYYHAIRSSRARRLFFCLCVRSSSFFVVNTYSGVRVSQRLRRGAVVVSSNPSQPMVDEHFLRHAMQHAMPRRELFDVGRIPASDDARERHARSDNRVQNHAFATVQSFHSHAQVTERIILRDIHAGIINHQLRLELLHRLAQRRRNDSHVLVVPSALGQFNVSRARLLARGEIRRTVRRKCIHFISPPRGVHDTRRPVALMHV